MKFSNRQSIRLDGYDYSSKEAYFVTICTNKRSCLFGKIIDGNMSLNDAGVMVKKIWLEIPNQLSNTILCEYVIMPNHFHAIVKINNPVGAESISARNENMRADMESAPTGKISLSKIVQTFKRYSTIEYIKMVKQNLLPSFDKRVWQRNYWEHIIRNHDEYKRIKDYIKNNPSKWKNDQLNIDNGNMIREKQSPYGHKKWMV